MDRPARDDDVAIATRLEPHGRLTQIADGVEVFGQQLRLVVKAAAADFAIDLLQADQIGILFLDHADYALEIVAAIAAADALVDVVTQKPHRTRLINWHVVSILDSLDGQRRPSKASLQLKAS